MKTSFHTTFKRRNEDNFQNSGTAEVAVLGYSLAEPGKRKNINRIFFLATLRGGGEKERSLQLLSL